MNKRRKMTSLFEELKQTDLFKKFSFKDSKNIITIERKDIGNE